MSLTWKPRRPTKAGWYWARRANGKEVVVQIMSLWPVNGIEMPAGSSEIVAWAGPLPRPREPSREQLAVVRYKLDGAYLPPRPGGWGSYHWDLVDRAEMLRRARVSLLGDPGRSWSDGSPMLADSEWVNLLTSRRRNGRWARATVERFTSENIDAAIARCAAVSKESAA